MARRIRLLSEDLANKIAAGEVVERPASVVKELLENAIDAGSTSIWVEVNGAGQELIRVADDGEGMDPEDAPLALQRHSTSKIGSLKDLETIATLGFRGEALPSIAAVSYLELITREATALSGTRVVVEGGEIKEVTPAGRPLGTTVTVRHLFYNTPARRKFLKSPATELRHITRIITALAMAYPEIAFHFTHNRSEIFAFPQADSWRRLEEVYGRDLVKQSLPVEHSVEGLRVFGWLGKPEAARTSRAHQFTYVNRRPVFSRSINHALLQGYEPLLPKDRFPWAVLFIEIDPGQVDVNVHPTKWEVRFGAERKVHDTIVQAVSRALRTVKAAPQIGSVPSLPKAVRRPRTLGEIPTFRPPVPPKGEPKAPLPELGLAQPEGELWAEKRAPLLQFQGRYIVSQRQDELVIVDQHAAHERVIYEATLKSLSGRPSASQQLLFPLTVELSPEQMELLHGALLLFQHVGFDIHPFGQNTVLIEAVPNFIRRGDQERAFLEVLDELMEGERKGQESRERLAAALACKAAVKDGDPLSEEEMEHLLNALFTTEQPFFCPHGRPTLIHIPLTELDRKFKR